MAKPIVTTLCGSTRFPEAFALANMHLTMLGRIVIGLGCFGHADQPTGAMFLTSDGDENAPEKKALDQLHFRKIDLSDTIFVVNPGGYVGSSTKREIAYARSLGKTVEWLFPVAEVAIHYDEDNNKIEDYAEMRRRHWQEEAYRLADLVRSFGGDPELTKANTTEMRAGLETGSMGREHHSPTLPSALDAEADARNQHALDRSGTSIRAAAGEDYADAGQPQEASSIVPGAAVSTAVAGREGRS